MSEAAPGAIRLDKWLWQARFFKSRSLAAEQVSGGWVRVNAQVVTKTARNIVAGDILTFSQAGEIRVVRVLDCGTRRGPASEAQALYEDILPESAGGPPSESP